MTRFIAVLLWSILISSIVSYVLTSMASIPFHLNEILILAAIFVVAILLIGSISLKEEN